MSPVWNWIAALGAAVVILPLAGWVGFQASRAAAKPNPGLVDGVLILLLSFFTYVPPPPPRAERVTKKEGGACDPPTT